MATKKSEVDAWTSTGKGVKIASKPTAAQKAAVAQINHDMSAKKSTGTKKKKK